MKRDYLQRAIVAQKTARLYYETARACLAFNDRKWCATWQQQAAREAAWGRYWLNRANGYEGAEAWS